MDMSVTTRRPKRSFAAMHKHIKAAVLALKNAVNIETALAMAKLIQQGKYTMLSHLQSRIDGVFELIVNPQDYTAELLSHFLTSLDSLINSMAGMLPTLDLKTLQTSVRNFSATAEMMVAVPQIRDRELSTVAS